MEWFGGSGEDTQTGFGPENSGAVTGDASRIEAWRVESETPQRLYVGRFVRVNRNYARLGHSLGHWNDPQCIVAQADTVFLRAVTQSREESLQSLSTRNYCRSVAAA